MDAKITSFSSQNPSKIKSQKQYSFNNDFVQIFVKSSIASEPKFWSRFNDCLVSCDSINFVKNCVSPRRNHYFHKVGDVENQNFIYKYLQKR